jgi:hypothetical protein
MMNGLTKCNSPNEISAEKTQYTKATVLVIQSEFHQERGTVLDIGKKKRINIRI